ERKIAKETLSYVKGIAAHPRVKRHVDTVYDESVLLKNGIEIRIMTADSVSVRGSTIVCAILDELCFWPHEPLANSDVEVIEALRPALAPVKGAPLRRIIGISSAGVRDGFAYRQVQAIHGKASSDAVV